MRDLISSDANILAALPSDGALLPLLAGGGDAGAAGLSSLGFLLLEPDRGDLRDFLLSPLSSSKCVSFLFLLPLCLSAADLSAAAEDEEDGGLLLSLLLLPDCGCCFCLLDGRVSDELELEGGISNPGIIVSAGWNQA